MKHPITIEHKRQFEEIRKKLITVGASESNFIKVELLFYEALSVAREYGDDVSENGLLAALKQLQGKQYQETKGLFKKSIQRERVIRRFISSLKAVLTAGIKNTFFQPQLN
jgi:hypothetical protein